MVSDTFKYMVFQMISLCHFHLFTYNFFHHFIFSCPLGLFCQLFWWLSLTGTEEKSDMLMSHQVSQQCMELKLLTSDVQEQSILSPLIAFISFKMNDY